MPASPSLKGAGLECSVRTSLPGRLLASVHTCAAAQFRTYLQLASLIIACGLHTQSAQELYLRLTGLVATPAHAHASAPASALATAPIHGHQRAAMATPPPAAALAKAQRPPAAAGMPSLSKAHPRLPTAVQAH